jgi:hypothetical protein
MFVVKRLPLAARLALGLCLLALLAACQRPEPTLTVSSPNPLTISGTVGRSTTDYVVIRNTGGADLRYSLEPSEEWLALSSRYGTLPPGSSTAVRATGTCPQEAGVIRGEILIESNDPAGTKQLEVTVTCAGAPDIEVVEESLALSARISQQARGTLTIRNAGSALLYYAVGTEDDWLAVAEPQRGNLAPGQSARIGVFSTCGNTGSVLEGTVFVDSDDAFQPVTTVPVTLRCDDRINDAFDIELRYSERVSAERQAVFARAAARWSDIITDDLPDWPLTKAAGQCGNDEVYDKQVVDDLIIFVDIQPLQGGEALAAAGPCMLRGAGAALPVYGTLTLNASTLAGLEADGTLEAVVLHQIGHVLGIGTAWIRPDLYGQRLEFVSSPAGQPCESAAAFSEAPVYTGAAGVQAYQDLGGEGRPPVEAEGGRGTQCSHWAELEFGNELMSSALGPGDDSPLSILTIGALADLGYTVDPAQADPYTLPTCTSDCLGTTSFGHDGSKDDMSRGDGEHDLKDIVLEPSFLLTPEGEQRALPTR